MRAFDLICRKPVVILPFLPPPLTTRTPHNKQAGAFWATAGLLATAFYQLLVKTRQDKLGCNSFQLLHYQAPQSALLVLACTPLFDKVTGPGGFLEVSVLVRLALPGL